jgi:hypothetical protein
MSLWEYKVITSGKGGFATPALLEKFLNDLGRDEWEIIHFHTPPDNFLAFTGLARRSTQRDWTLEDAAAAAAKAEAEKLRAEFEAKFKAAAGNAPVAGPEERAPSFLEEKVAPDDGFRKLVDTSHDDDPDAEEEDKADEWDKLTAAEEDELPTFFEAIKPHMRRNQRGPGMSVGVDYLAKKWDQTEDDLKAALGECGFVVPADEDAKPEYLEYDGDLYWLNVNRRGELWINTKEKPRPVFRPVKAARVEVEAPAPKETARPRDEGRVAVEGRPETSGERSEPEAPKTEAESGQAAASAAETDQRAPTPGRNSKTETVPLPEGSALLDKIRPHMRRNRRGPGGSGSTSFLSRALRTSEAELKAAFSALGLAIPATPADKPVYSEIGNVVWWLNLDSRGGLWINGREKKEGETVPPSSEASAEAPAESSAGTDAPDAAPSEVAAVATGSEDPAPADGVRLPADATSAVESPSLDAGQPDEMARSVPTGESGESTPLLEAPAPAPAGAPASASASLAAVRMLLKETKAGSASARVDRLADDLGKPAEEVVATLLDAGLRVPDKPREKPAFVEHAGEVLWLNRNARGELWLNARTSKGADREAEPDDGEDGSEPGEASEGEGEKKARRPARARTKKPEGKESSEEKVES